jgi:hypothetical protein
MSEAGAAPQPSVSETGQQVLSEHRQIRELAGKMEVAADLNQLLVRLAEFRALVSRHFVTEEAVDGLYDLLRETSPRQLGRIALLEKEHQALLAEIDRIAESARQCLAGPIAEVFTAVRTLTRHVRKHEAAEDSVLMDAMYTDLGQGD